MPPPFRNDANSIIKDFKFDQIYIKDINIYHTKYIPLDLSQNIFHSIHLFKVISVYNVSFMNIIEFYKNFNKTFEHSIFDSETFIVNDVLQQWHDLR